MTKTLTEKVVAPGQRRDHQYPDGGRKYFDRLEMIQ